MADPLDMPMISIDLQIELKLLPSQVTLRHILHLLSIPPEQRSETCISTLVALTNDIQFFQKLVQEHGSSIHAFMCQFMKHHKSPAGEYVFKEGDDGDKFYIILSGSVRVLVTKDKSLVEVARLSKGWSFGHVALIQSVPRNASIQCVDNCYFATLDKRSFDGSFGKIEAERVKKSVMFLKSIPLFKQWTARRIEKICFLSKKQLYNKNTVVFKEGQDSEHMFIVKSGDFILTKLHPKPTTGKYIRRGHKLILNVSTPVHSSTALVSIVSERELIGEHEVRTNKPYFHTCKCITESGELWAIKKSDFHEKCRDEQSIKYLINRQEIKDIIRYRPNNRELEPKEFREFREQKEGNISYRNVTANGDVPRLDLRSRSHARTAKSCKREFFSPRKNLDHIQTGLTPSHKIDKFSRRPSFKFQKEISKRLTDYFKKNHYSANHMKRIGITDY